MRAEIGEYCENPRVRLWRYDCGQTLEFFGMEVPDGTELQFYQGEHSSKTFVKDGAAAVPDYFLSRAEGVIAYLYIAGANSGITVRKIYIVVQDRPKPTHYVDPTPPVDYSRLLPPGGAGGDVLMFGPEGPYWESDPDKPVQWENIAGRPDTFPPSAHNHTITDVAGLEQAFTDETNARKEADLDEKTARISGDNALQLAVNEARSIAEGRSRAFVFESEEEMQSWTAVNPDKLNIGDNLWIIDTGVPDFWWDGTQPRPLETQKVDLSDYYTKEEIALLIASKANAAEVSAALDAIRAEIAANVAAIQERVLTATFTGHTENQNVHVTAEKQAVWNGKKDDLYGLFVDGRATATTGYWHLLFRVDVSGYAATDINGEIFVQQLYNGSNTPSILNSGILAFGVRASSGTTNSFSYLKWLNSTHNTVANIQYFAINSVSVENGNYIEFYIYNKVTHAGYRTSIASLSSRAAGHTLTFTGYKNWNATTTLTELPTTGTIIYSELSQSLKQINTNAGNIVDLAEVAAANSENFKNYLPLAGGTMTGDINVRKSGDKVIVFRDENNIERGKIRSTAINNMVISAGEANIYFRPNGSSSTNGEVVLYPGGSFNVSGPLFVAGTNVLSAITNLQSDIATLKAAIVALGGTV